MTKSAAARAGVAPAIVAEIHDFCVANANPEIVRRYSRFFREGYDAFGVDSKDPEWESHRAAWVERLREAGDSAWLEAGDALVRTGKYEECSFAILFAQAMRDTFTFETFDRLAKWFDGGIRNWGHTDVICSTVLAHFVIDGIVTLDALAPWRESPHKYQRRAVPVMLIDVLKAGAAHKPLLDAVKPLMNDTERVVHQGLGWFLRELWKKDPKLVEPFLLRYKNTAARLIYQYATEKMKPEERELYRRTAAPMRRTQ